MLRKDGVRLASLRYRRPYWMMHLQGADNWRIYTLQHEPEHQRTEMLYQAWLGGLDRPYMRPACTAFQPLWLQKKRHSLRLPELQNPETAMERFVLDWHEKFFSFRGTLRPTVDDLHTAFDLVERPLDLSYAILILGYCRNKNDIHFAKDTFLYFTEACLRVGRKDAASHALSIHEKLGFWHIDSDIRKYLEGKQTWYKMAADGKFLPLEENVELNASRTTAPSTQAPLDAGQSRETSQIPKGSPALSEEDELLALQRELEALEAEETAKSPGKK